MDASRFDRLSKRIAGANSRRNLVQALAVVTVAGVSLGQADAGAAKRRASRQGVGSEHWKKKKRNYCLNGQTIRRYRRKQEKLLAMGATLGKCQDTPPCVPLTCEDLEAVCPVSDGCGGILDCGTCDSDYPDCCAGMCVNFFFDTDNCGACGNVCPQGEDCYGGECVA
jgi:hypothetical protein